MPAPNKKYELNLTAFPPGCVTEYTTLVCLACIFDIFTKQLGLAPRTAYSEIKRHAPSTEELTSPRAMRPYFDSDEKNPHCPYCNAAKRWLARFDTYRIEGGKTTDAARRALIKKLPLKDDQFLVLEKKSDARAVLFDWLDTLGQTLDFNDDAWLIDAARAFLERREPKQNWQEASRIYEQCDVPAVCRKVGSAMGRGSFWRRRSTAKCCWSSIWSADHMRMAATRWRAG